MPKRYRKKRNNISVHQRIKCVMEWQEWFKKAGSPKPIKNK